MDAQTEILVLQLLVAVTGVAASLWVARRYGESAATRFVMSEEKRRNHDLLCAEQLSWLAGPQGGLREPSDLLVCDSTSTGVRVGRAHLEPPGYEASLMKNHLVTGYSDVWKMAEAYTKEYNQLVDQSQRIYDEVLQNLPNVLGSLNARLEGKPEWIVASFSQQIHSVLQYGNEGLWFFGDSNTTKVRIGSTGVFQAASLQEMQNAIDKLNSFVNPFVTLLREVSAKLPSIKKDHVEIVNSLVQIATETKHGVPLNGWCQAGLKGRYEFKA